jgi:diguanylate cyclase (GGDEF)-like protein
VTAFALALTLLAPCILAGALWRSRTDQKVWLPAGVGLTVIAVHQAAVLLDKSTTLPITGAACLLAFALWYFAFVSRQQRLVGTTQVPLWVDGVLPGLASGAGLSALVLLVARDSGVTAVRELAPAIIVIVGAHAICAIFVVTALMAGRLDRQTLVLVGGLMVLALGQLAGAITEPTTAYAHDGLVAVLVGGGLLAVAAAAWLPAPSPRSLRGASWSELAAPILSALVGCSVLVTDHFRTVPLGSLILGTVALLASLARLTWTLREIREMTLHRSEAHTDELTGLPNRRAMFRTLDGLTAGGASASHAFALLQLDLDGLKELNDTLGHQAGDELLVQVANRLRRTLPNVPARLGGDEFAAVIPYPLNPEEAAESARIALDEPLVVDGVSVAVNASIGIARFPTDATDVRELVRRADVAMYDAKRSGTGVAAYFPERDEHSRERLGLTADLKLAFERDELWLAFQPQVDFASGRISGAEALIRWRHPVRGDVPPGVLIPVAERSGLMPKLTLWVLERAVAQAAAWRRVGLDLRVAVNVSAMVLVDTELPERISAALTRHALTPDNLVVEVTEDAVMSDPRRCIAVLERIEALRVGIAIDDFGTGHSSLEQLKRLPAEELKLDRSFVLGMVDDPDDAAIVHSVVGLGRALGLRVVAEGVESAPVWQALAELGCDVAQGFGIARPMPAAQFLQWSREPTDRARLLVPNLHTSRRRPRRRRLDGVTGVSELPPGSVRAA